MRVSVLTLGLEVVDNRPDWPVVSISVDGKNPFEQVAKEWRGFDPGEILGAGSPLVPDDGGRRVAVYRCSCGEAGCGVIAPYVVPSPDRTSISWVDFRDYTGVFMHPVSLTAADHEGRPWDLPDIHFDRGQYLSEVRRVTSDRSWETPRRRTARLLDEHLRRQAPAATLNRTRELAGQLSVRPLAKRRHRPCSFACSSSQPAR